MAGQRGGRRRAPRPDGFRDALVAALADALDVEADRLRVSVELDDAPVPAGRLPIGLTLEAGGADEADDAPAGADAPEAEAVAGDDADDREVTERDGASGDDRADDTASGAPSGAGERDGGGLSAEELDEEAEAAADLLEGLLDAMDLPGDLRISVQDAHAEVEVVGLEEGVLIGRRGQTLDAVQELVRTAMQRRFERRSRVLVDVDGYRARRMEKLLERADDAVEEVLESGEPQRLEPMDSIERRLVHQRVAETPGVTSTSHGREPARRIVIERAED